MECCRSDTTTIKDRYEKCPVEIKQIYPESNTALVEAIYSQDLDIVRQTLAENPNLSNSWVSLHATDYKRDHYGWTEIIIESPDESEEQPHGGIASTHRLNTIEPVLLFAATIHYYKGTQRFIRNIPQNSIEIVQTLVDHGARFSQLSPCPRPTRVDWAYTLFEYIPEIQDCAAIIEILLQAEANPIAFGSHGLYCAARYDAGNSAGVLLDWMMQRHDMTLSEFLSEVHLAAQYGNYSVIDAFLQRGGMKLINQRCHLIIGFERVRSTLLMAAVSSSYEDYCDYHGRYSAKVENRNQLVRSLISAGADISDLVTSWLVFGENQQQPMLFHACRWASTSTLKQLIPGQDVNHIFPYDQYGYIYRPDVLPLIGLEHCVTYLHLASQFHNYEAIALFIQNGAQVKRDSQGRTPLHWLSLAHSRYKQADFELEEEDEEGKQQSIIHSAAQTAIELIDGAKVAVNEQDKYGCTALFYACSFKLVHLIVALLSRGANIGIRDKRGYTALHSFAQDAPTLSSDRCRWFSKAPTETAYSPDLISSFKAQLELEEENVDAIDDRSGKTALAIAIANFSSERVKLFIAMGANPNMQDNKGWSSLHYAVYRPVSLRREPGFPEMDINNTIWEFGEAIIVEVSNILLAAGANEALLNDQGQTAADLVSEESKIIAADKMLISRESKEYGAKQRWQYIEEQRAIHEWKSGILAKAKAKGFDPGQIPEDFVSACRGSYGRGIQKIGPNGKAVRIRISPDDPRYHRARKELLDLCVKSSQYQQPTIQCYATDTRNTRFEPLGQNED